MKSKHDQTILCENVGANFSYQVDEMILYVRKKPTSWMYYKLEKDVLIGRDYDGQIVYVHTMISKKQARIYFDQEWWIEDLQSKNGVYVNRKRITISKLKVGDWISIAGFDLYFCPLFLRLSQPDKTTLTEYTPSYVDVSEKERKLLLIENKDFFPKNKQQPFSLIDEMMIPMMYPLMLIYTQQISWFVYVSLLTLFLRMFRRIFHLFKTKFLFHKENKAYQAWLKLRYCKVDELENYKFYIPFTSHAVRIGTTSKGILIHDFKEAKRLLILGNRVKANELLKQLLYQVERYYPDISFYFQSIDYPYIMSEARFRDTEVSLGINVEGYDYLIYLSSSDKNIILKFDAVVNVDEGWYFKDKKIKFKFDPYIDDYIFSRNYAYLNQKRSLVRSFTQVIGLDNFGLETLRQKYRITDALVGILGYENQDVYYLDLHEQKHGPHLLVAGMSGSGKSEWLTSYLLSIAIFYDSKDVNFFVIDFKGGGLCALFEKLNHTAQVFSNLDEFQIYRVIAALEDEIKYREKVLLDATEIYQEPILDIHQLKKRNPNLLAHLLIVVDEFAELKLLYPEMMQSLVRLSRTGRSLGIHLVLCTQRPNGIVDRQMESNIQTRLCMKVATKQDSYDVLGNDQAFKISQAGQWIFGPIKGKTAFVDKRSQPLVLHDLDKKEIYRIAIHHDESMKMDIIEYINEYSSKAKPLFVSNIMNEMIPEGFIGIYDDYKNRQIIPFNLEGEYLIYQKDSRHRHMDSYDFVLFFEKKEMETLLMKKIPFEVDDTKMLGGIYMKGGIYQCKVRLVVT